MSKPEWGTKHTCQSCGAKYYDLNRTPAVCPKCGTEFDPDALLRSRRIRSTTPARPEPEAVKPKEAAKKEDKELEDEEIEDDEALVDDDEVDEDLIEDASELGEDDDDMAEVVIEDDEKEDR